jgi:Ca-activated chloride channel family protein
VAQREGDALRIDYFRAAQPGAAEVRTPDRASTSFQLAYRAGSELGTAYSPTHDLESNDREGMRRVAVRGDARDVTVLIPVRRNAAASITMLPHAPGGDRGFALITLTPPVADRAEPTPRDVTLVLDVSGSMQGRKMEQARAAGRQLLATLRSQDRFRIIDFATDVHSFRDDFVHATEANLRDAGRYLEQLDAVGSTNIEGALAEAMRASVTSGRLPLVLFITDGEPTVGERSPERLAAIATRSDGSRSARRIFTFGLGSDVNVTLLEQMALGGRGTAQFVRPDESVERMVGVVAGRLIDPVLTEVRVRVDGDVRLVSAMPSQPADVFAGRDLVVLARYEGHGSARVIVEGMQRGRHVEWTSRVDFPERERDNPFVARLWATQRVGVLSAERRERGASPELDDEIRTLGERYGIPTELTSYLVLEPGMSRQRVGMMGGGGRGIAGSAMPASAPRQVQFEAAITAADNRAATSLAKLDSASSARREVGAARDATRQVDGRTFTMRDSAWTDIRYRSDTMKVVSVKPYSKAYFDLLSQLPELRAVFALGDRVIVVGKAEAIRVDAAGAAELSQTELARLVRAW